MSSDLNLSRLSFKSPIYKPREQITSNFKLNNDIQNPYLNLASGTLRGRNRLLSCSSEPQLSQMSMNNTARSNKVIGKQSMEYFKKIIESTSQLKVSTPRHVHH